MNDICQSVSVIWVLSTLIAVGDTETWMTVIEFIWTFCTKRQWGHQNIAVALWISLVPLHCSRQRATLWNFHYLIFVIFRYRSLQMRRIYSYVSGASVTSARVSGSCSSHLRPSGTTSRYCNTHKGSFILERKRKRRRFQPVALFPIIVFILQRQQQRQRLKKKSLSPLLSL